MRMTDRQTDQSRVEVDKLVTINILDNAPVPALGRERIESDQGLGDYRLVLFDERSRLGTWWSHYYLWILIRRQTDRRLARTVYY